MDVLVFDLDFFDDVFFNAMGCLFKGIQKIGKDTVYAVHNQGCE
jgi:hypothetical protein